jgi:hypothetical protein
MTEIENTPLAPAPLHAPATLNPYSSPAAFEVAQRIAKSLAASAFVPQAFRENVANCLIALEYANRLGSSPLPIMQSLYVVHGKPAFSAAFLIGLINASPAFRGRLRFVLDGDGDARGCHALAIDAETGAELAGTRVTVELAKRERWYDRDGSKWRTMPDQMLIYRAATFFARAYAPELALGMQTLEEIEDISGPIAPVLPPVDAPAVPLGALVDEPATSPPDEPATSPPDEPATSPPDEPGTDVPADSDEPATAASKPKAPPKRRPGDTAAGAARAPAWPKRVPAVAAPDAAGAWVDVDGLFFDPAVHAWSKPHKSPAVTKKGRFRKARGAAATAPDEPATGRPDEPGTDVPPGPDEPATAASEPKALNATPVLPADASPTLRSLTHWVGQAPDAAALNRLENHPETAQFSDEERDFYRSAIAARAAVLQSEAPA